jgi:hypothetical protein
MPGPVFVIHGVGNRCRQAFEDQVAHLRDATGRRWDMKAVYWGDLGANDQWVKLTIPSQDERDRGAATGPSMVRDDDESVELSGQAAVLAAALLAPSQLRASDEAVVRDGGQESQSEVVAEAAVRRLVAGATVGVELREGDGMDVAQAVTVRQAIIEHWQSTTWLRQVTDPLLLEEIGAAVGAPLADRDVAVAPAGEELRDEELRGPDLGAFVKRRLSDLDRVVGATIGAAAGRLNSYLRTEFGPTVTRFFGDVLVYQRRRAAIHQRVRATIHEVDPALGHDPQHAVQVIGHSLGGVIAVDLATADEPVWISSLVTFGSQSPFFHVCDPRGGQLVPFEEGRLVQLPRSLGVWTNLWEPMDLLAFVAAKVFRMYDGSAPVDLAVDHLASSGLWTHSAYWQLSEVTSAIEKALERDGSPAST